MKPIEQATAVALLHRWLMTWEGRDVIPNVVAGSPAEAALRGLAAATKAFLSNQPTSQPSARAVLDAVHGFDLVHDRRRR